MKKHFSLLEVLEIAQDMEKDGREFYLISAKKVEDKEIKSLLVELADWELNHYNCFEDMKKGVLGCGEVGIVDPDNEASLYLNALVTGAIFDKEKKAVDEFAKFKTVQEILSHAIKLEKDSIAYYLGLKDLVSAETSKVMVDEIIREEMRHVRILSEILNGTNDGD